MTRSHGFGVGAADNDQDLTELREAFADRETDALAGFLYLRCIGIANSVTL